MSDMLRITGMASGLDVDSIVKGLMKAENLKLDKAKQNRQRVQWRQDAYRDILGSMNTFSSTYFDILKPDSYMLSENRYSAYDITSSDTSVVTATAQLGATSGNYVMQVDKIARSAELSGNSLNTMFEVKDIANWQGKTIDFQSGDKTQKITIGDASSVTDINSLVSNINNQITAGNLNGKLSASAVTVGGKSYIKLTPLTTNDTKITATTVNSDIGSVPLSIKSYSKNTLLSSLDSNNTKTLNFTYNGKDVSVKIEDPSGTKTVSELISEINAQTEGKVIAKFDDITGKFVLKTTDTGSGTMINVTGGTLMSGLGLSVSSAQGSDAVVRLTAPGGAQTTITQASNNFTINDVKYSLVKESTTPVNIAINSSTQKTFDKIKGFIDKYNDMIAQINTKLNEKINKDYPPLTDDQRKAMKDDEIKAWEDKAKAGILRNDSNLDNMLIEMRSAFYEKVDGVAISLTSIGLSTSDDTTLRGKIIYDEKKLKDAIENNGTQVAKLFSKDSTSQPLYSPDLTTEQRNQRNKEEGIFQRINDIYKDYARVTQMDSKGKRGTLVELAGVKGDYSETHNLITKDLTDKDKAIKDLIKKLSTKETNYYNKFSKLETAMQKLNSQQSWLAQQLGTK